jgi:large exoprotein involved in heme utilization and adhesion
MTRARDVSRLITTPPSIYATDTETSSAGYLTNSSASSTYQTKALNQFAHRNLVINGDTEFPTIFVAEPQLEAVVLP